MNRNRRSRDAWRTAVEPWDSGFPPAGPAPAALLSAVMAALPDAPYGASAKARRRAGLLWFGGVAAALTAACWAGLATLLPLPAWLVASRALGAAAGATASDAAARAAVAASAALTAGQHVTAWPALAAVLTAVVAAEMALLARLAGPARGRGA